ncbi:hypothetical protein JK361_10025 [Streptomyces sp. 5-8]|uniref:Phage shock protein PspC N-terminal domain-containing protein n=1 Tax=Streptomyces musisoli TaxID=2802280 RepID=A0ABS1NXU3_9ACTN|nr:hypothetical protein [Streptomyces musisoli]MBL1104927.1 hypothetical protein [Streptomyces musisoli]
MRAFVDRVYRGSSLLALGMARGTVAWFKEGQGTVDFLIRLVFLLGGLAILWGFIRTAPVLMFPLTVWWVIAAFRKGKPEEAQEESAEPAPQESPEPAAEEDDSPKVLEALRESADPHVHLAVIAQRLGTDTAHVREVLTRAGVPISDVRMKGRGVSTGVKGSDIPSPGLSPDPSEPVVGPGQDDNNNTELTLTRLPSGGQVLSVPDPTNPARTHVKVIGPIES